jgi:hypothetical protein
MQQFGGLDVTASAISITKAGVGLSDALDVAPVEYEIGDRVYVVLDTVCVKVAHEEQKDLNELRRVHTLRTTTGTIVDEKVVRKALDAQRRTIAEAQGKAELPLDDEPEEAA